MQSILRCGQCNKPFDKQSSLKRHVYYCRSRTAGVANRPRSCLSCAKGKARCDSKRPECSRCMSKVIQCHYPGSKSKGESPRIPYSNDTPAGPPNEVPSLAVENANAGTGMEASEEHGRLPDSVFVSPHSELADLGGECFDWNDTDVNFADFLDLEPNVDNIQYSSSDPSSMVRHSTPLNSRINTADQVEALPNIPIPTLPAYNIRSLVQRPRIMTGTQRTANLIFYTLKSYPRMMLRPNSLPPFIHPSLISSHDGNDQMESLDNCISLMHMVSSGIHGSRKLFWKNVRLECERLHELHSDLDKWGLLAAMQALSIYLILRISEGEAEYNNLDTLLLATVTAIAKKLAWSDITYSPQPTLRDRNLRSTWEDWVFEESRRRLCIIYQVVNMLVYFEPAAMCEHPKDLLLAPLPAKKHLWEAGDELTWRKESEREPDDRNAFGLAASGDLVKLDGDQVICHKDLAQYHGSWDPENSSRGSANWEDWCSGMDGFGGLIMLAASSVG